MKRLDVSTNPRIPVLMELVNSMNRFSDPWQLLEAFIAAMRRVYGSRCYVQLSTRGLPPGEYRIVRMQTHDGVEHVDWQPVWRGPAQPVHRGGILGEAIISGRPAIFHDLDLPDDPVVGRKLAPYHSMMVTPMFDNAIGVNTVVILDERPDSFRESDLEETILRTNLVGAMVNNLETARQLGIANEHIQREMDSIGRIQKALLPGILPEIPGLQMAASYRTFDRAGGDLYDIAALSNAMANWRDEDEGRWAILIGDVSGHGPAAAVVMAMCHAIQHAYPIRPKGPGEMLRHLNRHLCATRIEQSFVTAFLGFYDATTRQLTYARAGHQPPILKDFPHSGSPQHLDAVGELPLGIFHDVNYHEATVTLRPGQTLILYTDGITEAKRPGGDLFGIEGIENSLIACTGQPDCAIRHITEALASHQADVRPNDDQTVIAIQVV
jgi:sigma-B regulation protein RsbU (phosphoserine phosphatase)